MYILGLHNDENSGACLVKDGRVIAAANEERFNRIKEYKGFPHESIKFVLREGGIALGDVNKVVYGWMKGMDLLRQLPPLVERAMEAAIENPQAVQLVKERIYWEQKTDSDTREQALQELRRMGVREKVEFVDHHTSHAASAFYTSPFKEALVITMDGRGDYKSVSVRIGDKSGMKEVDWFTTFDSMGYFYSIITKALGFKPHRHEGKVTGLAAAGDPKKCRWIMDKMVEFQNGRIHTHLGEWYRPFHQPLPAQLEAALKGYSREDIAAAAQSKLEEVVLAFVSRYVNEYKISNICLAGGVFANVLLNMRILQLDGVKNIYIHPHMGDGGIPMGSALYVSEQNGVPVQRPLEHAYLGPQYSNEEVEATLKKFNLPYEEIGKQKSSVAAELIQKDVVVGWFQGRMEYGPRALGARSILYHAKDKSVNDWLNKRMERSEFMPFAPVSMEENAARSYVGWKPEHIASWFMTLCYPCTPEMKASAPAAVHLDGTARPQVVRKKNNPDYHGVLEKFYKDTGGLALVNTSFNHHEEPIVCSPTDAVNSYLRNNVDALVIGEYLVRRKK